MPFFVLELAEELELQPRFFGKDLQHTVEKMLIQKVEGTCSGQYGFIICVTGTHNVSKGLIRPGTGSAVFTVRYTCIVMRPFKGEVLDCVVTSVNKMGFFAEAGPLQIFVSNHLIPEDFEFTSGDEPAYVSTEETGLRIQTGAEVRVRIVGTRVDAQEIFCVGTIKDDFLGVIGLST